MSKHRNAQWVPTQPTVTRMCPLDHEDEHGAPAASAAAPGLFVCWEHRRQFERDVRQMADLHEALGLQLHPDGPALQPFTTGQGELAPFVNERAATLRGKIVEALVSWAAFVCDQRHVTAPDNIAPDTLATFLVVHVRWITEQDWAQEPIDHFRELSAACYSAAYPRGWHRVVCGRCLEVTSCDITSRDEVRCPGELVVSWSEPADLEPEGVDCTVCGKTWAHRYWSQLGKNLQAAS